MQRCFRERRRGRATRSESEPRIRKGEEEEERGEKRNGQSMPCSTAGLPLNVPFSGSVQDKGCNRRTPWHLTQGIARDRKALKWGRSWANSLVSASESLTLPRNVPIEPSKLLPLRVRRPCESRASSRRGQRAILGSRAGSGRRPILNRRGRGRGRVVETWRCCNFHATVSLSRRLEGDERFGAPAFKLRERDSTRHSRVVRLGVATSTHPSTRRVWRRQAQKAGEGDEIFS